MKLNKKSILALVLSLAMAMSLVPFAAFAEDGENAAPRGDIEFTVDEDLTEEAIEKIAEEILEGETSEEVEAPAETEEETEAPAEEAAEETETPAEEQTAEEVILVDVFDPAASFEYIMDLSDDELENYISSLTVEQQEELLAYSEAYFGEVHYGETVSGVIALADDTVNVTEAAPLVKEQPKKKLMKALGAPSKAPLQGENDNALAKDVDGLITSKTATCTSDDEYTISLEAYTTGTVSSQTTAVPTDIVLVLDQSGSMTNNFTQKTTTSYKQVASTENITLSRLPNLYVKLGNGSYAPLEITLTDLLILLFYNKTEYTYSWTDENGLYHEVATSGQVLLHGGGSRPNELKDKIYQLETSTEDLSRLDSLKIAANDFIDAVCEDAITNTVDHRIAVVGFASNGTNYNDSEWENTELLSTQNVVGYNSIEKRNYSDALVSANVNGSVNPRLTTAINRLDANGGTYINNGLEMAQGVFNNTSATDSNGTKRNRVVVILTDGVPGNGSWGNSVTGNSCASAAISIAIALKNTGVTVYSVGIFDGADATSAGSNTGTTTQKTNYFMQQLSSNNGTPQTPSYYMSAGNPEALNNIFQSISEQINTPAISLGSETVVRDIVSKYFKIPEGASVSLYTADCNGVDENGVFAFGSRNTYSPKNGDVVIDAENGIVDISGFNFDDNFCAVTESGYKGKKLIIEFTVTPKDTFWGGNGVPTNGEASGVYTGSGACVENFEQPKVDVPIKEPAIRAENKTIYYGQDAPAFADLFIVNEAREGWDDAFVNIETVYAPNTVSDTADGTYKATVSVTPKTDGTYGKQEKDATAKVTVVYCTLTIDKSVTGLNTGNDENQSFIFHVVNDSTKCPVDMDVCVVGSDRVTIGRLPIGTYTVTEKSGWSWRYSIDSENSDNSPIKLEPSESGHVKTFGITNKRTNPFWLNGCSYAINSWTAGGVERKKIQKGKEQ